MAAVLLALGFPLAASLAAAQQQRVVVDRIDDTARFARPRPVRQPAALASGLADDDERLRTLRDRAHPLRAACTASGSASSTATARRWPPPRSAGATVAGRRRRRGVPGGAGSAAAATTRRRCGPGRTSRMIGRLADRAGRRRGRGRAAPTRRPAPCVRASCAAGCCIAGGEIAAMLVAALRRLPAHRLGAAPGAGPGPGHPRHRHRPARTPGSPRPAARRNCGGWPGRSTRWPTTSRRCWSSSAPSSRTPPTSCAIRCPRCCCGSNCSVWNCRRATRRSASVREEGKRLAPGAGRPARPGARRARRSPDSAGHGRRRSWPPSGSPPGGRPRSRRACRLTQDGPGGRHRLGGSGRAVQRAGRGGRQRAEVHPGRRAGHVVGGGPRRDRLGHGGRRRPRAHRRRAGPDRRPLLAQRPPPERATVRAWGCRSPGCCSRQGGGALAYAPNDPHGLRVTVTVPRAAPED